MKPRRPDVTDLDFWRYAHGIASCDTCGRTDDHNHPIEYDGRDGSLEIDESDEAAMIEDQDRIMRDSRHAGEGGTR